MLECIKRFIFKKKKTNKKFIIIYLNSDLMNKTQHCYVVNIHKSQLEYINFEILLIRISLPTKYQPTQKNSFYFLVFKSLLMDL